MRHLLANGNLFLKVAAHGKQPTTLTELVDNEFREVTRWISSEGFAQISHQVAEEVERRAEERRLADRRGHWCLVVDSWGLGGGCVDFWGEGAA